MSTSKQTVDHFAHTFDAHDIRERVEAPHFGSWLLMRRQVGEGWTSVFWCRVTAADGLLRVSGDFDPIIFRGHLSHADDPIARVAWMGSHEGLDHYVVEKARAGSGRDACTAYSVDDAKADLRVLYDEEVADLRSVARDDYGDDESEWPDDALCSSTLCALQDGIDVTCSYSHREGVFEVVEAVWLSEHEIEMEIVSDIGERPSNGLRLAHLAVQRLHALLSAEAK